MGSVQVDMADNTVIYFFLPKYQKHKITDFDRK